MVYPSVECKMHHTHLTRSPHRTHFLFFHLKWKHWNACCGEMLKNPFSFLFCHSNFSFLTYFHLSLSLHFWIIFTFLLFISSSFSHVLFPFHSFLLVILNCATSTLPNYVPPTERKKCTHTYPLTKSLYPIPLNYLVFSLFLFTVIPHILCSSTPA